MKKKKIKKELKNHRSWLKDILKGGNPESSDVCEIKSEIRQINWILKMFKK